MVFLSVLAIGSGRAEAGCMIVVGGPYVKPAPRAQLTAALGQMFKSDSKFDVEIFETENLIQAARLGADYIVYLTGTSYDAQVQFRDILLNKVVWEQNYDTAAGFQKTVDAIRRDMKLEVMPLLPGYCHAAES